MKATTGDSNGSETGTVGERDEHPSGVTLGPNSKVIVSRSQRGAIQTFYRDVLGCKVEVKPNADVVWLRNDFHLAMVYGDDAPSAADLLKSIWLELRVRDPRTMKRAILNFGIEEIEYTDKQHFYFQAPGGQVFRLAENADDPDHPSEAASPRPCFGE